MDTSPKHFIIMGVSGSGKTSFGKKLAQTLSWSFIEGDDFHPENNKTKMSSGIPLNDEDRVPWLKALANEISDYDQKKRSTITACSALKKLYREILRQNIRSKHLFFIHLDGNQQVISDRLSHRSGHFFPQKLLQSQLETLEPLDTDEAGIVLDVTNPHKKNIIFIKKWMAKNVK